MFGIFSLFSVQEHFDFTELGAYKFSKKIHNEITLNFHAEQTSFFPLNPDDFEFELQYPDSTKKSIGMLKGFTRRGDFSLKIKPKNKSHFKCMFYLTPVCDDLIYTNSTDLDLIRKSISNISSQSYCIMDGSEQKITYVFDSDVKSEQRIVKLYDQKNNRKNKKSKENNIFFYHVTLNGVTNKSYFRIQATTNSANYYSRVLTALPSSSSTEFFVQVPVSNPSSSSFTKQTPKDYQPDYTDSGLDLLFEEFSHWIYLFALVFAVAFIVFAFVYCCKSKIAKKQDDLAIPPVISPQAVYYQPSPVYVIYQDPQQV